MACELWVDEETMERLKRLSKTLRVTEGELVHNVMEWYEETLKALEIAILGVDGEETIKALDSVMSDEGGNI